MKRKKKATKEEAEHMNRVAELGCLACRKAGYGWAPAELHHPRFLVGGSQRAGHKFVIPICARHHRTGGYGVALHAGQVKWESIYGTEQELLEQVYRELGITEEPPCHETTLPVQSARC